jgi:polyisoprenoid-binding protein YceI
MRNIIASTTLLILVMTSAGSASPANPNPAAVTVGAYVVEPNHTRVQFSVMHLGFTHWNGDFTTVSGTLNLDPNHIDASKLDVSIPVTSVSTTNATLDGELKSADWFDAKKFPTMHFVATKVVRTSPNEATITGDLTLHGVTKPLELNATFNGAGVNPLDRHYTVGFDASGVIKRSEFGVKTYVPLVGDETTLHISAAFVKAS